MSMHRCPSDAPPGFRDLAAEGMFEYGCRVGVWRVLRLLADVPVSIRVYMYRC